MPKFFIDTTDPLNGRADGSFISPPDENGGQYITVTGDDARHIARSLRMRPGERLTVCDGEGTDYECVLEEITDAAVTARVTEKRPSESEPTVEVTLYQAYPKGDKLEFIIEKATELGAKRVTPVMSERSVARPDDKAAEKKLARWQRHAVEAAKQSGRGAIPEVEPLADFAKLENLLARHDRTIFCYECGGLPLAQALEDLDANASLGVYIGAEGGISESEAEQLKAWGAVPVTLGKRILRCETAPLAAITAVMLLTGNLE